MKIFTIEKSDFLNEFYNKLTDYTYETFHEINHSILKDKNNYYSTLFNGDEITGLIMLNKNIFQNMAGFFKLIDYRLPLPAFNSLRAAIECTRLFRLYFLDKDFRQDYLLNRNINFDEVRDNKFTQANINKRLEEIQNNCSSNLEKDNELFTKGSAISRLHSELSKWSHALNINLSSIFYIDKHRRIYLGIDDSETDEYKEAVQHIIRKYIEGSYILVSNHFLIFSDVKFRKEYYENAIDMVSLYDKFIKNFYKE